MLTFVAPVENSLHRGYVDDPRRCGAHHFAFEFADEMKRHDGVDNLSGIAIEKRDILNRLNPGIDFPSVNRLPKLITVLKIELPRLKCNGIREN